ALASSERVVEGERVTFQYDLTGGNIDRSLIKYYWYVYPGGTIEGQGTPVIVLDTSGLGRTGWAIAQVMVHTPYDDRCESSGPTKSVRVLRNSQLKADLFWDWFVDNADHSYAEQMARPEGLEDLAAHLRQVDPDLTYQLLPIPNDKDSEHLIIGYSGKEDKSKIVKDLVDSVPLRLAHVKVLAAKRGQ
ncbi:MAG: hypothetical protein ACJ73D_13435, partial [Pyrinomonadaceae bacterium]